MNSVASKRTVDPVDEPWTLAEVAQHLRVTDAAEHSYIASALGAARQMAEDYTGRALLKQTWKSYWHGFPTIFTLGHPPLISVTAIRYLDADGTEQTLATSVYRTVSNDLDAPFIELAYGESWPSTRGISQDVHVEYIAGYGESAELIPLPVRKAILLQVGDLYEHRASIAVGTVTQLHLAAELLLVPYVAQLR
ncbi:MAG TPA: hypothetical protein VGA77_06650 [Propylenella sp.]